VQNIVREDSVKIIEVIKEAKRFLGFSLEKKVVLSTLNIRQVYLNARIAVLGGSIDSRATTGRSVYKPSSYYKSKSCTLSEVRRLNVVKMIDYKGEKIEINMVLYLETVMSSSFFDKEKLLQSHVCLYYFKEG
jgi:hypothetical protein